MLGALDDVQVRTSDSHTANLAFSRHAGPDPLTPAIAIAQEARALLRVIDLPRTTYFGPPDGGRSHQHLRDVYRGLRNLLEAQRLFDEKWERDISEVTADVRRALSKVDVERLMRFHEWYAGEAQRCLQGLRVSRAENGGEEAYRRFRETDAQERRECGRSNKLRLTSPRRR